MEVQFCCDTIWSWVIMLPMMKLPIVLPFPPCWNKCHRCPMLSTEGFKQHAGHRRAYSHHRRILRWLHEPTSPDLQKSWETLYFSMKYPNEKIVFEALKTYWTLHRWQKPKADTLAIDSETPLMRIPTEILLSYKEYPTLREKVGRKIFSGSLRLIDRGHRNFSKGREERLTPKAPFFPILVPKPISFIDKPVPLYSWQLETANSPWPRLKPANVESHFYTHDRRGVGVQTCTSGPWIDEQFMRPASPCLSRLPPEHLWLPSTIRLLLWVCKKSLTYILFNPF